MTIKDGGRAYPQYLPNVSRFGTAHPEYSGGMTLRDHFAGLAMQGMASSPEHYSDGWAYSDMAIQAYELADAMLKAREAEPETCKPALQVERADARRPLTDEEIDQITRDRWGTQLLGVMVQAHREYARAIERAHKIGGNDE